MLRWNNSELGNVSPLKFIKIAEDSHFIIPLGTWVLQKACKFLNELHMQGYEGISMSVNVSVLQLLQIDFCNIVKKTLKEYNIAPHLLELEVTESMLIECFDAVAVILKQLSDMKVRIALDDFGKGYSSLNYLKQLPIDTLKIDKSFIDQILDNDKNNLAGQIIKIGKSMNLSVVAEGVEHQDQLNYLQSYGCDKIQGYLYSRPVPELQIINILEKIR